MRGHAAREVRRLAADRVLRGPLPRTLEGVGPELLTTLLGRRVTSVQRLGGTEGTTDRVRLALTGDGVPESVFVKTASHSAGVRLFGGLASLGETEVRFYDTVRPALEVEAPTAHASVFDPRTGRFLLVLDDLEARGATFADTLTPLTPDEAARALDTLRAVHAAPPPTWALRNADDPMLGLITWSLPRLARRVSGGDPEADWLLRSYRSVARQLETGTTTLLHGDPHPGNLYLLDGRVGLLDWQVVRRGNPLRDVTYLIVLGLTPEDRARHERDLLAHYRADAGTDWETYRRMVAYAYVATTFTSGLGGLQGTTIADEGHRRASRALRELETLCVLSR